MQMLNHAYSPLVFFLCFRFLLQLLQEQVVCIEKLGYDKVHQRPELSQVVLQGSSAEKKFEIHVKLSKVLW